MNYIFSVIFLILVNFGFSREIITVKLKNKTVKLKSHFPGAQAINEMKETRTGYFKKASEFCQITLIDANFSGYFNDIGADYIYLSHEKTTRLRIHFGVSNSKIMDDMVINIGNTNYKITHIDAAGEYIEMVEVEDAGSAKEIKLISKMPDMIFKKTDGSTVNFRDFISEDKYIFVEFWGTWCKGCLQILPRLKSYYNEYSDKLCVIYLNSKDSEEDAIKFLQENNLSWINGFATEEIRLHFLQNAYPYGVLFDKSGKVIKFDCHYLELEEFLKTHK